MGESSQPGIFSLASWNFKLRQEIFAFAKCDIATLCNKQRVIACFWNIFEELTHLSRGLYIELMIIEFKALGIGQS